MSRSTAHASWTSSSDNVILISIFSIRFSKSVFDNKGICFDMQHVVYKNLKLKIHYFSHIFPYFFHFWGVDVCDNML